MCSRGIALVKCCRTLQSEASVTASEDFGWLRWHRTTGHGFAHENKNLGDVGISVRPAERRSTQPAPSSMGNAYPLARTVPQPAKASKAAHSAVIPESSGIEPFLSWAQRCEEAGDRSVQSYWVRGLQVARSILGDLQTGVKTLPCHW